MDGDSTLLACLCEVGKWYTRAIAQEDTGSIPGRLGEAKEQTAYWPARAHTILFPEGVAQGRGHHLPRDPHVVVLLELVPRVLVVLGLWWQQTYVSEQSRSYCFCIVFLGKGCTKEATRTIVQCNATSDVLVLEVN